MYFLHVLTHPIPCLPPPPRDKQPLPSPYLGNRPSPTLQKDNNPSSSPHEGNQLSSTPHGVNLLSSSTHTCNQPLSPPDRCNQYSHSSSHTPHTASEHLTSPVASSLTINTSSKTKPLLFTPNTATQTVQSSELATHNTPVPRNIFDNLPCTCSSFLNVPETTENASVGCTIDDFVNEELQTNELQTEAAKLICKLIGNSSDPNRFDTLCANLK